MYAACMPRADETRLTNNKAGALHLCGESQKASTKEEGEHRLDLTIWQERSRHRPLFIRIETGSLPWHNAGSAPIA